MGVGASAGVDHGYHQRVRMAGLGATAAVWPGDDLQTIPVGVIEVVAAAVVPLVDFSRVRVIGSDQYGSPWPCSRPKISSNPVSVTRNA